MLEDIDLSNIQDENARQLIVRLMNLIEAVTSDLRDAQAEIQRLRDEINRLKGEQGKPKVKANTPKPPRMDYSSEQERRKPKPRQKRAKKAKLEIPIAAAAAARPTASTARKNLRGASIRPPMRKGGSCR